MHRLLNLYCEIIGMSSYGEGCMSLQVRLIHMNECWIFHNIGSTTFLLYYYYIPLKYSFYDRQCFWLALLSMLNVSIDRNLRQIQHFQRQSNMSYTREANTYWHEMENNVKVTWHCQPNNGVNVNPASFARSWQLEFSWISWENGTAKFFILFQMKGRFLLMIFSAFTLWQCLSAL